MSSNLTQDYNIAHDRISFNTFSTHRTRKLASLWFKSWYVRTKSFRYIYINLQALVHQCLFPSRISRFHFFPVVSKKYQVISIKKLFNDTFSNNFRHSSISTANSGIAQLVKASAMHAVGKGFNSFSGSYQRVLKNRIHSFSVWRSTYQKIVYKNWRQACLLCLWEKHLTVLLCGGHNSFDHYKKFKKCITGFQDHWRLWKWIGVICKLVTLCLTHCTLSCESRG